MLFLKIILAGLILISLIFLFSVVDWRKEPRRSRSGISWLVDGPKIQTPDGKSEHFYIFSHRFGYVSFLA